MPATGFINSPSVLVHLAACFADGCQHVERRAAIDDEWRLLGPDSQLDTGPSSRFQDRLGPLRYGGHGYLERHAGRLLALTPW